MLLHRPLRRGCLIEFLYPTGCREVEVADVDRGERNVGLVNVDRLAGALELDLPSLTSC
jgi:hypothetical protein